MESSDFLHIRMCPACRSEYQPHIETCLDCGTRLEGWSPPEAPPELPPIDQLVSVSAGDPWQLDARARYLASMGIPSCIETDPPGQSINSRGNWRNGGGGYSLALYVAQPSEEEASRLVREFIASRTPASTDDASQLGVELEACPACGTAAVPDASACHDCGLEFPNGGDSCPTCGESINEDQERCPACGERFEAAGR